MADPTITIKKDYRPEGITRITVLRNYDVFRRYTTKQEIADVQACAMSSDVRDLDLYLLERALQ